jgi:hypothetical protein
MNFLTSIVQILICACLFAGLTACAEKPVEPGTVVVERDKGFEVTGSHLRVKDRRSAGVTDASAEAVVKAPTSPSTKGVGP